MIDIDANIDSARDILTSIAALSGAGESSVRAESQVLREWQWAAQALLFALDRYDAVRATRELESTASRLYTGEHDHWSRLWQLAAETDRFIGGDSDQLRASASRIASLA